MQSFTYLALGDSYTIGESVLLHKNFPYQLVQLLRKKGFNFHAPEIIAKTGWTTDELSKALEDYTLLPKYDFVSLLIGVNNQYRGRNIIEYKEHFESLLEKALELSGKKKDRVFIISIPDYSVTPFASDKDPGRISKEIGMFNKVKKAISIQYKVHYIDITPGSKKVQSDAALLAEDGLHPSEKEYLRWAKKIAEEINQLK